jgi:hypothetical protein
MNRISERTAFEAMMHRYLDHQRALGRIEPAPGMVRLRAGSQAELLSLLVSGA